MNPSLFLTFVERPWRGCSGWSRLGTGSLESLASLQQFGGTDPAHFSFLFAAPRSLGLQKVMQPGLQEAKPTAAVKRAAAKKQQKGQPTPKTRKPAAAATKKASAAKKTAAATAAPPAAQQEGPAAAAVRPLLPVVVVQGLSYCASLGAM